MLKLMSLITEFQFQVYFRISLRFKTLKPCLVVFAFLDLFCCDLVISRWVNEYKINNGYDWEEFRASTERKQYVWSKTHFQCKRVQVKNIQWKG